MTIGERLVMGAAKIRRGEWRQHALRDSNYKTCAIGSLFRIDEDPHVGWEVMRVGAYYIAKALGDGLQQFSTDSQALLVGFWNDAPERTVEHVADALELAALLWEQDQKQQQEAPAALVGVGV